MDISYHKPNQVVESIKKYDVERYVDYWECIEPKSELDTYLRFIFAFLSVHAGWEQNVKAYEILRDNNWQTKDELQALIKQAGIGLDKLRTRGIYEFTKKFKENPDKWKKLSGEGWAEYRNRMEEDIYGLGFAKTAFAAEMIYPKDCGAVCMDVHMLRLYGQPSHVPDKRYYELESHWYSTAKERKYPSYIARCVYWDGLQNQKDTRYWSHVFEKVPGIECIPSPA